MRMSHDLRIQISCYSTIIFLSSTANILIKFSHWFVYDYAKKRCAMFESVCIPSLKPKWLFPGDRVNKTYLPGCKSEPSRLEKSLFIF